MDTNAIINQITTRTMADGGATYNLQAKTMLDTANVWLYPQFPGLTRVVAAEDLVAELEHFINDYTTVLDNKDLYLGTWINPQNNQCYIDVIAVASTQQEATQKAKHLSDDQGRNVISIYNPATRQVLNI